MTTSVSSAQTINSTGNVSFRTHPLTEADIAIPRYVLAICGDKSPFDTAVIVEINQYRQETKKLRTADALLKGYDAEIASVYRAAAAADSMRAAYIALLASKDRLIVSKDQTIRQMGEQFDALLKLQAPRPTWFARNKFWLGILTGGAVSAYICLK